MFTLITGGSGSGKSAFAESLMIERSTCNRYYIATMIPIDEECHRRIQRHQKMRSDKQFITLEVALHLESVRLPFDSQYLKDGQQTNANILLECMSNLVANELYEPQGAKYQTVEEIMRSVQRWKKQCKELIIVTNEVFSDGSLYTDEMQYRKVLGDINRQMAQLADEVIEVVYGIAVYLKRR